MAVLAFENLSTQRELDWAGAVAPSVLSYETVGAAKLLLVAGSGKHDLSTLRATEVLRGHYQVEGERLRLVAELRDVMSNQVVRRFEESGKLADGPMPLLDGLSRELADGVTRPFPYSNRAAVEKFGAALLEIDPAKRADMAEAAFGMDPKLTAAAMEAAETRLARGDGAGALRVLEAVTASGAASPAPARLLLAFFKRDASGMRSALEQAVAESPRNTDLMRELGELTGRLGEHGESQKWFRKALELEPQFTGLWNLLAYSQAYGGDFKGALESAAQYRKLGVQDPNSFDSSGEILWMAGRFEESAKDFLAAQERDPLFLGGLEFAKAAFARLMAGDRTGADQVFARYLESRRAAADPIVDLRQAHWLYLSGRRQQAMEALQKVVGAGGELGARASAFGAVWLAQQGRKEEAQKAAAAGRAMARTPGSLNMAGVAALLASPGASAEEWQKRAAAAFNAQAPAAVTVGGLAYALFLDRHYKESAALFARLMEGLNPGLADEMRALLAGSLVQAGEDGKAAQILSRWPLPPAPGESMFASLWFPDVIEWRARAVEKTGGQGADTLRSLHRTVAGQ